ncbi:MAG: Coproporphyrin ferrochelatase, partial [uncultured Nocardioides sp.]
ESRRCPRRDAVRRPAAALLRRPREGRGRGAVPGERHPGPGDPAGAPRGGGRALLPAGRPQSHQRPEQGPAGGAPRRPRGGGHRHPRLLGQPQLGPLPHRRPARDGRGRGDPGGGLRHVGVLVVLLLPAVPREPRRRRGGGRGCAAARPAAPVLQPPGVRRAGGRCHPRRAGGAARGDPRPRAPGLRHPLGAGADGRDQRTAGVLGPAPAPGVRHPAPQRRGGGHRSRAPGHRPRPPPRPRLLLPLGRPADPLARARRQRPPRGPGGGGDRRRRPGADRVRLRPHGGHLRPRHRGPRHGTTAGTARDARGDPRRGPALRRDGARPPAGAGGLGAGRGAGPPGGRRHACVARGLCGGVLPQPPHARAPRPLRRRRV